MSAPMLSLLSDCPLRVIDVGARGSIMPALAPIRRAVEVVAFEPDEPEYVTLHRHSLDENWRALRLLPLAAARAAGIATLFVTRRPDLSSLRYPSARYHPNEDWDVVDKREVPTISIGQAVEAYAPFHAIDFLKVDTQGTELEVLEGVGDELAAGVLGVQVEARFFEQYAGQACLPEVDALLRGWDLLPFATENVYFGGARVDAAGAGPPVRRRLSHCDALYLREPDWIDGLPPDCRQAAVRRLAVLYGLFGFCDLAVQIVVRHLPDLADLAAGMLPVRENPLRWRLDILVRALVCVLRPSRVERYRLAETALTIRAADGREWRLSPPRL